MKQLKLLLIAALLGLSGCATIFSSPEPATVDERFTHFPQLPSWPVEKSVKIFFNEDMIPFVEAQTDDDGAFAVGVVHAYLRIGQMEVFRRGSAGRLSESAGPFGTPAIDQRLRVLDLGRSAKASYEMLSPADKSWLDNYLRGINFFLAKTETLPYEFTFLNIKKEDWTYEDSIRIAHLAGGDANWSTLFSMLTLRNKKGWQDLWAKSVRGGKESIPTVAANAKDPFSRFLAAFNKVGSNSVVVGKPKTGRSGMIASDPHLGIFVPNLWLLMGYKTPSYHVLGYMLPGVPAVTLGRNKDVAWGGTYMRGISSHFFEVTPEQITGERVEVIERRGWFDKKVTIKESVHGPVVFEGKNPETGKDQMIALNWVGHQPSSELAAYLGANRASNWQEFRSSFKNFAVSGLNVTYADRSGNVGFLPAIRQPILKMKEQQEWLVKSSDNAVISYRGPLDFPSLFNPKEGYFASANNMPIVTDPPLAQVFAKSDRMRRWQTLFDREKSVSIQTLKDWQQDVYSDDSFRFNRSILKSLGDCPENLIAYCARLSTWDGRFNIESSGAVAYEVLVYELADQLFSRLNVDPAIKEKFLSSDDWRHFAAKEFEATNPDQKRRDLVAAMNRTLSEIRKYKTWGDWHYQKLQTPLGLIPVLGSRFSYGEFPSPGSSSTLHKAAFANGKGRRHVVFGAQARHVSDMSDLDENYFILLGGNDGWLENEHIIDQVGKWRNGEYLKVPLKMESVRKEFRRQIFLLESDKKSSPERMADL